VIGRLVILALATTFVGSALVMKLAPAANLLGPELSDKIVRQYQGFYEELHKIIGIAVQPAGNAHGLMVYLATIHLVCFALFVFPSGRWSAKLASLWAIVTMVGAEYVVSITKAIPPFVPESLHGLVPHMMRATHIGLALLATLVWFYGYSSLGVFAIVKSLMAKLLLPSMLEEVCACGHKFWDDALYCSHCGRRRLYESYILQTLLALTFTGSALAMKVGPALGLVPVEIADEVLSSYNKFIEVLSAVPAIGPVPALGPFIQKLIDALMLDNVKLMLGLAASELLSAVLLAIPGGVWPARVAALWIIIVMVGAEYCTRMTGFVPPGTPSQFHKQVRMALTVTHVVVGLMACIVLTCSLPSLRAVHRLRSFWQVKESDTEPSQPILTPAAEHVTDVVEDSRGRTPEASAGAARKRDSTPVPRAQDAVASTTNTAAGGKKRGYKAGGASARGAAAAL